MMLRCQISVSNTAGRSRRLFVVRHGDVALGPPRVLYDPGAFGIYADGHWVGQAFAEHNMPLITYSRAGLYRSDPVPDGIVPDPLWHADDMARLLDACGVSAPVLLVAHSMAGLRAHAFASQYPDRVAAVLLVDAVTPEQLGWWVRRSMVRLLTRSIGAWCWFARAEFSRPLLRLYPNYFDLEGAARRDKTRSWGDPAHLRATQAEILAATNPSLEEVLGPIEHCPVGSVAATPVGAGDKKVLAFAAGAGQRTERLYLPKAGHARLLSPTYAVKLAALGMALMGATACPR
ncbi:MAG: alpha/beta hydrolase [Pseudomonadota bacterium]